MAPTEKNSFDRFSKLAGGIQSIVMAIAVIVGGYWGYTKFKVLLETRIAIAQAEKIEAEAVSAKRQASESKVIFIDLATKEFKSPKSEERWVEIDLCTKNTGNQPFKLELAGTTKFYISKVLSIDSKGMFLYGKPLMIQFDYPDKTMTWIMLHPGSETERLRTVQKLTEPGLYIVRFSMPIPDSSIGKGREYSCQTFFLLN